MTLLRWILVIPVSFACGIISTMLARVISRHLGRLAIVKMVTGFIAGFLCIFIASWIAPNQQKATMLILVVIYGFYWMSEAQKVAMVSAIVSGQRVDWLFVSCTLGGIVAAFA
jgi:fructose-specific phosphotransferase system IIC component